MSKVFTLSHFLRRSGEVLEAVDDRDVVLARRDGDDLAISTVPRSDAFRAALEILAEVILEAVNDESVRAALARSLAASARWTSVLPQEQRAGLVEDVARSSAESAGLGSAEPLVRALDRWRQAARTRAIERPVSAHLTRPVAIPDDIDDKAIEKATGVVELPLRVRWSYPRRTYDLDDPRQRRLVYEQVLSEGLDSDVRWFIDVEQLIEDWNELVLPQRVRRAWAEWLRRTRGVDVAC